MANPIIGPQLFSLPKVEDLLLWDIEERYCRSKGKVKNEGVDAAAVAASGTVTTAAPVATFVLTMAPANEAGNLGDITLEVVQATEESVVFDPDTGVLTVNANVSGGTDSITELVALIHAHADFVVSGTTNGAGVVTTSTTGSGTISGGQDAVAVLETMPIGTPLIWDTDHYRPCTGIEEADAFLLQNLLGLIDDQVVEEAPILINGPALVNYDAIQFIPYSTNAAQVGAMAALNIKFVNEPVVQSSDTID